jgi:hypothetical protein
MEPSSLIVAGIMAISNLGGISIMLAWYAKRIDATDKKTNEHATLFAQAADNQKATAETLTRLNSSVMDHEKNLIQINEMHELKGCKTLFQSRNTPS